MIISSIASGVVLLEDSEKEAGALVVDIGGGTTDWMLYRNGFYRTDRSCASRRRSYHQ